jgi:hypothetical protein
MVQVERRHVPAGSGRLDEAVRTSGGRSVHEDPSRAAEEVEVVDSGSVGFGRHVVLLL